MRRLRLVCLAALLVLSGGTANAQVSDGIVKIGVLTDLSGPAATATGPGSVTAAQMAVADFGGTVLGNPISVISADHQIKPDIAAGIARQWYDVDHVDLIVDVPVSAVGLAVQQVANDRKKLFITHSTGTADFHGKFCSPYTMQWVFDTHALAVGTAQEVVKRGGDTWFFLTADYACQRCGKPASIRRSLIISKQSKPPAPTNRSRSRPRCAKCRLKISSHAMAICAKTA
jgi:branched-chain amino acid transport system substrate-binding protein